MNAVEADTESLSVRLWRRYGQRAFDMLEHIRNDPSMATDVMESADYLRVELHNAADHEMIVKLEDFSAVVQRLTSSSQMMSLWALMDLLKFRSCSSVMTVKESLMSLSRAVAAVTLIDKAGAAASLGRRHSEITRCKPAEMAGLGSTCAISEVRILFTLFAVGFGANVATPLFLIYEDRLGLST